MVEAIAASQGPIDLAVQLGTIQVLRQQRGGWVGSENGNFY